MVSAGAIAIPPFFTAFSVTYCNGFIFRNIVLPLNE